MSKEMLKDEYMKGVNGGFMHFNYYTQVLTYTHEETGEVTKYQILDFEKAWKLSNKMHGDNKHEDVILSTMLENGYIQ